MKRSVLAPALSLAALALGGCATQSTATAAHHAPAFGGPAARVVDFPSAVGPGQPREVRVLVDEPALKLVTIVLRQGTVLPEQHAPVPVTIQAPQGAGTLIAGTDLVLLVHHLGRGEESHP